MTAYKYSIEVVTESDQPAADLDYIKEALRLDTAEDDQLLETLEKSATIFLQNVLGRRFITTSLKQHVYATSLSAVEPVEFRVNPVSSITAITYLDADGAEQTWASSNYQSDLNCEPAIVQPVPTSVWPAIQQDRLKPLTLAFDAGYATSPDDMPANIKELVTMLVGHWFFNPEAVARGMKELPFTLTSMIDNLRWDIP